MNVERKKNRGSSERIRISIISSKTFGYIWLGLLLYVFLKEPSWITFLFLALYAAYFLGRSKAPRGAARARTQQSSAPSGPRYESELDKAYKMLDLKPGAKLAEVQSAYRELARVWHPDRFASDPKLSVRANAKLSEINQAYDLLRKHLSG